MNRLLRSAPFTTGSGANWAASAEGYAAARAFFHLASRASLTSSAIAGVKVASRPRIAAQAAARSGYIPAPAAAIDDLTGAIWGAIGNVIAVIPPNLLQATQTAFLTVLIAPVAGLIGLNVPPQLAPILPLIAVAYTVLSPVIAVGNFFSVLATGQPLPIYIPAGPLPWIYSVAATPPPAAPTAAAPVTVGATAPAPSRKAVPTSAVASASKPKPQQSPRSTAAIPKPAS